MISALTVFEDYTAIRSHQSQVHLCVPWSVRHEMTIPTSKSSPITFKMHKKSKKIFTSARVLKKRMSSLPVDLNETDSDREYSRTKVGSEDVTSESFPRILSISRESERFLTQGTSRNDQYRIFIGTWNVAGIRPGHDSCLEEWIDMKEAADIYVLGFQEIVPLKAGNVLNDDGSAAAAWEFLLHKTLNPEAEVYNTKRSQKTKTSIKELRSSSVVPHYCQYERPFLANGARGDYIPIASKQMVGIFLTVWVRRNLRRVIHSVKVSCVGCGLMGFLGNKGAVSVSMLIRETSFCFICSHLSSGEKQGDEVRRNYDAAEILRRTYFPRRAYPWGVGYSPQSISEHENIIWFGDLNYRLNLDGNSTMALLEKNDLETLLRKDQLKIEKKVGRIFENWNEGAIDFAPTYKYCLNSHRYAREISKSGRLCRTPAWCDRILWLGSGLKQLHYGRSELMYSDHRPIRAIFLASMNANFCKQEKQLCIPVEMKQIDRIWSHSLVDKYFNECIVLRQS